VIGLPLTVFITGPTPDNPLEILQNKGLKGERIRHYELPILLTYGLSNSLFISATPLKNSSNEVVGLIIVGQDITELTQYRNALEEKVKLRTEALNKALEKEKELATAKTRFAAIVSHEFRTPLATIRLAANHIKRYQDKLSSAVIDQKIDTVIEQVENMTLLLEDVLTLGRSQDVRIEVQKDKVELVTFCEAIKEQVENVFDRSHTVTCSYSFTERTVEIDEGLLRNIFVNLLSNAIKFSPDKTIVYLNVDESGSNFEFVIRDTGIGIPEKEIEKIFEPFDRGSNARGISGSGLGLSIVKKAVDLLKASISVTSQIGKGSVFTITLPKE
jgi:signal transduction histidine kinase